MCPAERDEARTVIGVGVLVLPDSFALGGEVQCLSAGAVYGGLVIGGFVIAVAAGGFVI